MARLCCLAAPGNLGWLAYQGYKAPKHVHGNARGEKRWRFVCVGAELRAVRIPQFCVTGICAHPTPYKCMRKMGQSVT